MKMRSFVSKSKPEAKNANQRLFYDFKLTIVI